NSKKNCSTTNFNPFVLINNSIRCVQCSRGHLNLPASELRSMSVSPAFATRDSVNRGNVSAVSNDPKCNRDRKSTRLNSSHVSISTLFPYTTLFRSNSKKNCSTTNFNPFVLINNSIRCVQCSRGHLNLPASELRSMSVSPAFATRDSVNRGNVSAVSNDPKCN